MADFSHIQNYLLYLKKHHGLSVSLHTAHSISLLFHAELIPFNIHDNSYCSYLKTCPGAQRHCVEKQRKVQKKCSEGSFFGTCYAGVREFVYPISNGEEQVGFISVSGYRAENADPYLIAVSRQYGLDLGKLREAYGGLKPAMPPKEEVDVLLRPLCDMLELACRKGYGEPEVMPLFAENVASFIRRHHTEPLSSAAICRHFGCSRSYLSLTFNRYMGKGIREYINELRMADAKFLLLHSALSVGEIASSVGFSDANYFSLLFKKSTGRSPMKYKKENSEKTAKL